MASIVTDHILNKLLCSTCKQYLSCGPTKVHSNGNMFCGRCNKEENKSTNSLYDKVNSHLLFPCINRYEGCNKLLQFKDVSQHEKVCRGTKFSCPLCPFDPSNQVTLLFLIDHYKSLHGEYFLKEPKFFIEPKVMSENVYLYCDNANNCVFLIKVSCTQDRVTLNASVPEQNTVSQRFRLNNILELPIKEVLCNSWEKQENQYLEAKIPDVLSGQDEQILCEFFYKILENKTLTVVMDLDSIDEPNDEKLIKLPKLCLDKKYFPGYDAYKISPCGSMLICENDPNMFIQLKCDSCDSYFWNVPFEQIFHEEKQENYYGLYSTDLVNSHLLICFECGYNTLKPVFNSPILNLKVCCRYDCGIICCIWEIYLHEQNCDLNFEKDTEKFIKTFFKNNTFNDNDRFVRGNYIESFEFKVGYYEYSSYYDEDLDEDPEIPDGKSLTSQESIIYGVTDDGYKYKVYYKFSRGSFMVRVEPVYDPSKYVVIIRWMKSDSNILNEKMYLEQFYYTIISTGLMLYSGGLVYNGTKPGTDLICSSPSFIIIIKKKSQFTFVF